MEESISYDNLTGRYKIGVPWKQDRPALTNNHEVAVSHLHNTEKKIRKDPFVKTEYSKTIQGYVEKGYLRKVGSDEPSPSEV